MGKDQTNHAKKSHQILNTPGKNQPISDKKEVKQQTQNLSASNKYQENIKEKQVSQDSKTEEEVNRNENKNEKKDEKKEEKESKPQESDKIVQLDQDNSDSSDFEPEAREAICAIAYEIFRYNIPYYREICNDVKEFTLGFILEVDRFIAKFEIRRETILDGSPKEDIFIFPKWGCRGICRYTRFAEGVEMLTILEKSYNYLIILKMDNDWIAIGHDHCHRVLIRSDFKYYDPKPDLTVDPCECDNAGSYFKAIDVINTRLMIENVKAMFNHICKMK